MFDLTITIMLCIIIGQIGYIFLLSLRLIESQKELENVMREKYQLMSEKELMVKEDSKKK
jgi:hypothetical protein